MHHNCDEDEHTDE